MRNNFVNTLAVLSLGAASLMAQPQNVRLIGIAGPTILTESGTYMLTTGLTVSSSTGAGIEITGNNITLDLNGQTITGAGNASGVGVRVMGARNVVVRNGIVEAALTGVVTMNSSNVRIENMMIRGRTGVSPEAGIMMVQTWNSVVANNQIANTFLGIFVRGGNTFGNLIENNTMTTTSLDGKLGICYNPAPTDPAGPKGDLIRGNLIRGYRQAIAFAASDFNVAEGNTFIFRVSASSSSSETNVLKNNTEVKIN